MRSRWRSISRAHPKVSWVNYAALPDSKYNAVAKRITKGQASGIVSFGIKGGRKRAASSSTRST